jgi:hypothetical protein
MKRLFAVAVLALALTAGRASADPPMHYQGGLGFHNTVAPIGGRWWLNDKFALDAGFGISSFDLGKDASGDDHKLQHWAIDLGVPILLKSWDRVHFILRPGVTFESQDVNVGTPAAVSIDQDKTTTFGAEFEAEVFLADNMTVSAAHGISIVNTNPAGPGDSFTDWQTTGRNFTEVGFHVYLFGGK